MTVTTLTSRRVRVSASASLRRRTLHAGAWWVWALGLLVAASRTTNPLLLGLMLAVLTLVVVSRRGNAPWSRSFGAFLRLGVAVLVVRVVFQMLFGISEPGYVLVTVPHIPLPSWAAGVRIGGAVTAPEVLTALYDGLQLLTIFACVGAANSLASPRRMLRSIPAALYEVGVALVVTMSVAPELVSDVQRVRTARRLRGHDSRGLRSVAFAAIPVLAGALDRSLAVAASMDARGYGRRIGSTPRRQRMSGVLVIVGLIGVCIGLFGILDEAAGPWSWVGVVVGCCLAAVGFAVSRTSVARSTYRPDPWAAREWIVTASGLIPAAVLIAVSITNPIAMIAPVSPPGWPSATVGCLLAILVAALPAWVAPAAAVEPQSPRGADS